MSTVKKLSQTKARLPPIRWDIVAARRASMKEKAMAEIARIAETVERLAKPGMEPKDLLDAVRKEHPHATKKEVARAAFYAVILASEQDSDRVTELHHIAVDTRNSHDNTSLDDH
jgi:hypothetical protein